jgi:hypothetical protein
MRKPVAAIAALLVLLAIAAGYLVLRPGDDAGPKVAGCDRVASSPSAAAKAVAGAKAGATVCLADGTYATIALNASPGSPGVTLRAEHPGRATVAGVSMAGRNLTVAQMRLTGTATVMPGSAGMTVDHNLLVGGKYDGVYVCPATPPAHCDDVSITNNRFVGRFSEDAIHANLYHDGPDKDANGLLVEHNEFTGNVEHGGHNDVLQTVWVGDHLVVRGNYVHDFGGQGLFVKDQAKAIEGLVVEQNLIVAQDSPCDPASLCPTWQLSPFQFYGPIVNGTIRHNTVWPTVRGSAKGGGFAELRGDGWAKTVVSDNVFDGLGRDPGTAVAGKDNTRCSSGGGWPAPPGTAQDCAPKFRDPKQGDYRLADGRGVDWTIAGQRFGPQVGAPGA